MNKKNVVELLMNGKGLHEFDLSAQVKVLFNDDGNGEMELVETVSLAEALKVHGDPTFMAMSGGKLAACYL